MKSINRGRQNGSTNPANPQAEFTPPPAEQQKPKANLTAEIPEPGIENGAFTGFSPVVLMVVDSRCDETVAGCDITPAQLRKIKAHAKAMGLSVGDLLAGAVAALAKQTNVQDEIAAGFIQINMAGWQQKELRALARESGVELRMAISGALRDLKSKLRKTEKIKRITGLGYGEQYRFFGHRAGTN